MSVSLVNELIALLEPLVEDHGLELVTVEVTGGQRHQTVRVYLDRDGGIDIDAIAEANAWLSDALDTVSRLSGPFTLEVSSPGIERILRKQSDFTRFAGERVTLTGFRRDVKDLYQAFDVFVCPSSYEPFGRVIIEALDGGTPVIAALTGGSGGTAGIKTIVFNPTSTGGIASTSYLTLTNSRVQQNTSSTSGGGTGRLVVLDFVIDRLGVEEHHDQAVAVGDYMTVQGQVGNMAPDLFIGQDYKAPRLIVFAGRSPGRRLHQGHQIFFRNGVGGKFTDAPPFLYCLQDTVFHITSA